MRLDFDENIEGIKIINWIKDYFDNQPNAKGAIIGISGGKDSTVVSKLLVEALGKDRVLGVLMPNGEQKDINDSIKVVEDLGINYKIVNIEEAYNGLLSSLGEINDSARVNIAPRLRMTTLYAMGTSISYRICGTGNKSEAFVGYTTKWGDSACDFNPIANYTTEEVIAIGIALGLPKELVLKTPSDGLTGKSDEDNLGVTYAEINNFIENGTTGHIEKDIVIEELNIRNRHKSNSIPICK